MKFNSLDLKSEDIYIHLKLYDPITVLFGSAGSGKSFLCNAVQGFILNNPSCKYRVLYAENFGLWQAMLSTEDILWFIDDIDLLAEMYPESVDYINSGRIPLVVTGRNFSKFGFDYHAYQRLIFDADRKILTNDASYLHGGQNGASSDKDYTSVFGC